MRRSLASWNFVSVLCRWDLRRWSKVEIAVLGELGEEIGLIAQKFIERIARVVKRIAQEAFVEFLNGLQKLEPFH
ncbi:MAG: hypothetical protein ACLSB7_04860 [Parabacteroides distasonis]